MKKINPHPTQILSLWITLALFILGIQTFGQQVGDLVILSSTNQAGVPVHPTDGDASYVRWSNGTVGRITAIGTQSQWRKVEANGQSGWVTKNYLTVQTDEDGGIDPSEETPSYVVGAWNLEWLHNNKSRGFPEYSNGGPTYGPRTDDDYRQIAEVIRDQTEAKIMVLSEINGSTSTKSDELDRLITKLGGKWGYYLSPSSGQQRLAILFDSSAVKCTKCLEIEVAQTKVQDKDIFDRDPLVCSFTFLDHAGALRNDLLVVGVHLASGQQLNVNHDSAMTLLSVKVNQLLSNSSFNSSEKDIFIAGDFNASRYDNKLERFWNDLSPTKFRFKTLSPEEGDQYPGTRLAGVPLIPKSQIDYIMISGCAGGLTDEIVEPYAQVRVDLLPADFNVWRQHLSDHIPVTARIKILPDTD